MAWHHVCRLEELPPGEARKFEGAPAPIAIFNVGGELLATDDTCTHGEASLCEGYLDGDVIECPWHLARFSVRTGEALSPPAYDPIRTYPVKVEDGVVFVSADEGPGR